MVATSTNLWVNALDQLPVSVFHENDYFVVPELIAIVVVCHGCFSFLIDAFRDPPKRQWPSRN